MGVKLVSIKEGTSTNPHNAPTINEEVMLAIFQGCMRNDTSEPRFTYLTENATMADPNLPVMFCQDWYDCAYREIGRLLNSQSHAAAAMQPSSSGKSATPAEQADHDNMNGVAPKSIEEENCTGTSTHTYSIFLVLNTAFLHRHCAPYS